MWEEACWVALDDKMACGLICSLYIETVIIRKVSSVSSPSEF